MKIEVQGQQVEVDNDFASLSPEEQQKTVDDISAQIGHHEDVKTEYATGQQQLNAPPSGFFDMGNAQSGARQIVDPIAGYAGLAGHYAAEHPVLTAGAAAMLPNSILNRIPGGQKISAGKEFLSNLGNAAQAYAQNAQISAQKELRLQNRPGFGGVPTTSPVAAPAMPTASAMPTAPTTAQPGAIQRGIDYANQMRQIAAQKVIGMAPALEGAGQQVANFAQRATPYINNPLTRGIARLGGVGGQMATYSGGLNTNEEQELRRRRGMGPTLR
jgi:hypothetical protein